MLKSKLYWRVLANFALLLMILTAMTILTLNILDKIQGNFIVANENIYSLMRIEQLRRAVNDMPQSAQEYALTSSRTSFDIYAKQSEEFDQLWSALKSDFPDSVNQQNVMQLRDLFTLWVQNIGNKQIELGERMRRKEKVADLEIQLKAIAELEAQMRWLTRTREIIRELHQLKISSQPRSITNAANDSAGLGKFITIINVLLALFSIALGFILTRSITKPIQLLQQGTQNIMVGKFEPIELHRSDELGQLANDFNKMSAMLGSNYTRLQAYSELVTTLNNLESLQEVEEKSLQLLCHHTGASVGALYLLNKEDNTLDLTAGFALKQNGALIKSFKVGEGIPGQCALEEKIIEVASIPSDAGFSIDTGLVELVPNYITSVPILFQDRVIGVMVLGSMKQFSEMEKEIINNSVPQLSVAITNAINDDATRKLSMEIAKRNEELTQKTDELENAYRVKSDFLSSMSHELRTPLNSIIGFSSVLLGPTGDPLTPDQKMALEKILKNGKHLLQLINDILDLSKLESGRMTLSVESEDVPTTVSNAIMIVEQLIKSKGLNLVQDLPQDLPTLVTDVVKVRQILVNLLSNAAKFTEKGDISIKVREDHGMVSFAVKDAGIGIEKKNFNIVFEEFKQVDSSNTRKYKGTGLGLPISRRLARLLGGDITLESEIGKGAIFTLTIPPVLPKQETPTAKSAEVRVVQPKPVRATTPSTTRMMESTKGIQILCIDDDPDVIEILRKYLIPEGYSVISALSGEEGLSLAAKAKPALITLDIMMPQKDGWQVLRELKQNDATKDIPVIIHSIVENKPLAMSLGAVDVMTKPTDPRRLLNLIRQFHKSGDQFILVVDDHEDFALAFRDLLKRDGFNVKIATDGKKALEVIQESIPSLILLDLIMPGMDGFQVVRELQKNPQWKQIPVIILSGKELTDEEQKELSLHITDYMKKDSFSTAEMTNTIKRILSGGH
ncbi:MAG: response regulator [bacterium]